MKQAISFITLGVGDLARSRAFYRALGWRESSASQEAIAFYQAGSTAFALFARDALAEDAGVPPQGDGFLWEVCFNPFFPLDGNGFVRLPE